MPADTLTREIFGNIGTGSKIAFYAAAGVALAVGLRGVLLRVRRWQVGQPAAERLAWHEVARRLFSRVLSQSTLAPTRPVASRAHQLLFGGFAVLTLGTILIAVEHVAALLTGRAAGDPVFHKGLYFAIYEPVMELAGLALLVGCGWFLINRLKGKSSIAREPADLFVLAALLFLGLSGFLVEGLRIIEANTRRPGVSFVGAAVARILVGQGMTPQAAQLIHQLTWWIHAVVALGLLAAVPYTRLWHAVAGTLLLVTREAAPLGTMTVVSIEEVEASGRFGTAQLSDLTRHELVSLDACVSCGRCEDECPAHAAGKPLSPRDVVQALATRLGSTSLAVSAEPGPVLAGEVVSAETLWSCTACSACVEVCPLGVDPLGLITGMRRHLVGSGQIRGPAAATLGKLARSGNPWGLPAEQRFDWAEGLEVPTVEEVPDFEVLYWVGCAAAYDRQSRRTARAVVQLLERAGIRFAVLGNLERCTGESARRMGEEFVFAELARANITTLEEYHVTRILTHCPHCLNSFRNDYPQLGGRYEAIHHSEYLAGLVAEGRLVVPDGNRIGNSVTFHDPCYLARVNGIIDAPRRVLEAAGTRITELPRNGCRTACCGAGGGRMWLDDTPAERVGGDRVEEVLAAETDSVVVSCPFCRTMISDGIAAADAATPVKDLAEVLFEALESPDSPGHGAD